MVTLANYQAKRKTSKAFIRCAIVGVAAGGSLLLVKASKQQLLAADARKTVDTSMYMAMPITDVDKMEITMDTMKTRMEMLVMETQGAVCQALETVDGHKKFKVERWNTGKEEGGISCVMQDGAMFEKAGVNISVMRGQLADSTAKYFTARGKKGLKAGMPYFANGVSCVVHPRNPHCPTMHFNYRYFEVEREDGTIYSWFGGGTDLTPFILNEKDVVHFHQTFKDACDKHDPTYYSRFKKWCDEYFLIKHRGETRGVGGIFFDDMDGDNQEAVFDFVKTCTKAIVPSYIPILEKHKTEGFTFKDRQWQLLRRGRYAEYNLVYDRGTTFGLLTPGTRIESILMSMPLVASWQYSHEPEPGSKEAQLLEVLKKPKDWLAEAN